MSALIYAAGQREADVIAARLLRLRAAALRYLDEPQADELARNVTMGDEPSVAEVRASIQKRIDEPGWWPSWPGALEPGSATRADRLARALALAWAEPDVDDPEALRGDHLRQQRKDDR